MRANEVSGFRGRSDEEVSENRAIHAREWMNGLKGHVGVPGFDVINIRKIAPRRVITPNIIGFTQQPVRALTRDGRRNGRSTLES